VPEYRRITTIHLQDPREVIWTRLGHDLHEIELWGSWVVVGLYIRPATRTASGLEIAEEAVDEDRYQGKIGMVILTGPRAFIDNERDYPQRLFSGMKAEPGDWVVFRASDGLKLMIGDHECRLIPDSNIRARIPHPDIVF
jgi:hypothetical protein